MEASEAGGNVTEKVCVVTKTLLKFHMDDFVDGTKALSNLVYNMRDVESFYTNFLNCLNDQAVTATAGTTVRNIQYLIYQIQTYVIPGSENIKLTAKDIGHVFGRQNTAVFETFADAYENLFKRMVKQLKIVCEDFTQAHDAQHLEITKENLNSYVNTMVLKKITNIFRDLEQASRNLDTVVSGFTVVTETLETASAAMQVNAAATTDAFAQQQRALSLTLNNAKKRFTARTDVNIMSVVVSLADFETVLTSAFNEDNALIDSRNQARELFTQISGALFSDNTVYQNAINEYETGLIKAIFKARKSNEKNYEDFVADVIKMAAKSRGSAARCFGADSSGIMEINQIMKFYREAAVNCIDGQVNVTTQSQTLKTFINEDVVLNWMGAADELCGCIVKGDKLVNENSRKCVADVSGICSI